jgi:hypothetical protein
MWIDTHAELQYLLYFWSAFRINVRLSHLDNHCNEKLHFYGFWSGSSDLCRFSFQTLSDAIYRLTRRYTNNAYFFIETMGFVRTIDAAKCLKRSMANAARGKVEWGSVTP